jgi:hypothetical protein
MIDIADEFEKWARDQDKCLHSYDHNPEGPV